MISSSKLMLLVLISLVHITSSSKGILSKLYKKAVDSKKPFILILENNATAENSSALLKQLSKVRGEGGFPYIAHIDATKNKITKNSDEYDELPLYKVLRCNQLNKCKKKCELENCKKKCDDEYGGDDPCAKKKKKKEKKNCDCLRAGKSLSETSDES